MKYYKIGKNLKKIKKVLVLHSFFYKKLPQL